MMMDTPERVINILKRFKEMGVGIAIDDFGTGYSSPGYFQRFPVDLIKIEHSFVNNIGEDQNDAIISDAVIRLGHSMGFTLLAKGIENERQQQHLTQHCCDLGQRSHLGCPMPASEFKRRLKRAQGANK